MQLWTVNTYGLGWKGSFDNGVFIKTETLMQDWSDLKHSEATWMQLAY